MLNQLRDDIHENSIKHGWWEQERSFGEIIALCHSELSEALEEYRNGRPFVWFKCNSKGTEGAPSGHITICGDEDTRECILFDSPGCEDRDHKPEGIAIELADCIIRILDYCGHTGINIEEAIRVKHEYNKTRPYRHGGKAL